MNDLVQWILDDTLGPVVPEVGDDFADDLILNDGFHGDPALFA